MQVTTFIADNFQYYIMPPVPNNIPDHNPELNLDSKLAGMLSSRNSDNSNTLTLLENLLHSKKIPNFNMNSDIKNYLDNPHNNQQPILQRTDTTSDSRPLYGPDLPTESIDNNIVIEFSNSNNQPMYGHFLDFHQSKDITSNKDPVSILKKGTSPTVKKTGEHIQFNELVEQHEFEIDDTNTIVKVNYDTRNSIPLGSSAKKIPPNFPLYRFRTVRTDDIREYVNDIWKQNGY
jgi:hypothetical protein